ncbi:MAG: TRAP transporter large permease subunit [Bauldia sp.]
MDLQAFVGVGMLVLLVLSIFIGFPIAFTLMGLGIGFGYWAYFDPSLVTSFGDLFNNRVFQAFITTTYSRMQDDVLQAIPLFLFMGYIVERANVVDNLFKTLAVVSRRVPGALAVAALITCTLFATATGIVGAVVTLMGLLAFPQMLKARYDVRFASGVICAGGTLGILIPPSIMLIVYAQTAQVSTPRMYAGALIPGLILAGLYLVYILVMAIIRPDMAPRTRMEDAPKYTGGQIAWMLLTSFFPLAFLIMAVLGAIFFGLTTPSGAAALGAMGGILLAIGYRTLTWQRLKEAVYLTVRTSAMVCWLFVGSGIFVSVFAYLGGQQLVNTFVGSLNLTPLTFLIIAQIIIFLLGWPLEWTEITVIFIPIFLPLMKVFNVDPMFFGVLVAVNLQSAFLSPPMAMSAFYLKGISPPHVRLNDIFAGMMPYMLLVIVCMVLIYVFPQTVYWLPNLAYGSAR